MLVRIKSNATTINLNRFDYVRAVGKTVEAGTGLTRVEIAKCETEDIAKELEQAIFNAWTWPQVYFDVDKWFSSQIIGSK